MNNYPDKGKSVSNPARITIERDALITPACHDLSLEDFAKILAWHKIATESTEGDFVKILEDYDSAVKTPFSINNEDDILRYKNENCREKVIVFEYDDTGAVTITPVENKEMAKSTYTISLIKGFALLFMSQPTTGNDNLAFSIYPGKVNYNIDGKVHNNVNIVIIGLIHNGKSLGLYNISIPPTTK